MSNADAPPWAPVDSRHDYLSDIEIEDGTNVTSMCYDEIECPYVCDLVWHTITCEADGAARRTAVAAAHAITHSLDSGGTPDEAYDAAKEARSKCEDLSFVRWAYCHFVNFDNFGNPSLLKLPSTVVAQANDIPYETTVLGQYRIGLVLPICANDAVRLFNTACHIGASMCLEPSIPHNRTSDFEYSSSVFNHNNADGNCPAHSFLERAPDPNEVRKLKLAQQELSESEQELMSVVSHRAFKERGCVGDRELTWYEVSAYLESARRKEMELRDRIAANNLKKTNPRRKLHSTDLLQDELEKEHASLASVVLLDCRVSELRESVYRLSEAVATQHVIVWSRWSVSTAAHTPPEPPLIGEYAGEGRYVGPCLSFSRIAQICPLATRYNSYPVIFLRTASTIRMLNIAPTCACVLH